MYIQFSTHDSGVCPHSDMVPVRMLDGSRVRGPRAVLPAA